MSDDVGMIRVFLLDDHEVVRRGIAAALEAESDLTVVGEAGTADEAIAGIRDQTPDVAVLDVRLGDGELRSLYGRAVALCFPSLYEGFGLPPLEAMASGCCLVASRTGAIPEIAIDGAHARLVEPGDVDALASAIQRVLEDPELRRTLGADNDEERALYRHVRCAGEVIDGILGGDDKGIQAVRLHKLLQLQYSRFVVVLYFHVYTTGLFGNFA